MVNRNRLSHCQLEILAVTILFLGVRLRGEVSTLGGHCPRAVPVTINEVVSFNGEVQLPQCYDRLYRFPPLGRKWFGLVG